MRILVVDSDRNLLALVRRSLEGAGHQVRVAAAPEALDVAVGAAPVDLVLLDVHVAARSKAACKALRSSPARVIVTAAESDGDPTVSGLRQWFGEAGYMRKPFSLLDLPDLVQAAAPERRRDQSREAVRGADLLGRMASRGANGPLRAARPPMDRANRSLMPRSGGQVVFSVAARLANLWLERATGLLRVTSEEVAIGRQVAFSDGGLVDRRDVSIVEIALAGATLAFSPSLDKSAEAGDRMLLIQTLWAAAYAPGEVRFAEVHAFEAMVVTASAELCTLVSESTARVLRDSDGARALGEVIVQQGTTPAAVSAELNAMHRLGLLRFVAPAAQPTERRGRVADLAGETTSSSLRRARSQSSSRRTSRLASAMSSSNASTRATSHGLSGERRSGRATVAERFRRSGGADGIQKRLELELVRLKDAAPAEVLGIPMDAGNSLVEEIGQRMKARYDDLAVDESLTEEAQAAARQLARLVEIAVERWGHSHERARLDPTTQREAIMLEQAWVLIDAGDFPRADRVLTKARELAMANADILAALGWARFHNPERPAEQRTEEGRDFLMLAEQFDPAEPKILWMLCRVLAGSGKPEAALARAKRLVEIEPGHAEAKAMLKDLGGLSMH